MHFILWRTGRRWRSQSTGVMWLNFFAAVMIWGVAFWTACSFFSNVPNILQGSELTCLRCGGTLSGDGIGHINEVTVHRAWLVLGWVIIFDRQTTSVFHQATQDKSASYIHTDKTQPTNGTTWPSTSSPKNDKIYRKSRTCEDISCQNACRAKNEPARWCLRGAGNHAALDTSVDCFNRHVASKHSVLTAKVIF